MCRAITILSLFVAGSLFIGAIGAITSGERNMRLLANHQRNIIGQHLLDLNTGQPVVCDTDTDCYRKTGINY